MQRLFSTFANGWPGVGLLIQRLVTGSVLVYQGIPGLKEMAGGSVGVPQIIGAVLGMFMVAGLWTPVVGALVGAAEVWIALSGVSDPWIAGILATLGATLAMIGPGAYSMDARLFGRKHIVS